MTDITHTTPIALPEARVSITIRPGTMDDVPFMDALQKKTTKQVGWMPTKQFEGKIAAGHVLVAVATKETGVRRQETGEIQEATGLPPVSCLLSPDSSPVGYLIGNDQYFKRDDVGIIYQINVVPEMRRSLVAASLLKAQFERSAYGCRLYCCWCAQDIEANRFWEAMGFVPLAYRAGSERKSRVHIFWQKRIRAGDTTTAWWFPSKTDGGAIRADRIVLPIPPGTHWSDAKPLILPRAEGSEIGVQGSDDRRLLPEPRTAKPKTSRSAHRESATGDRPSPTRALSGGMSFAPPVGVVGVEVVEVAKEKPKRERRQKAKADPRLVAAARELRDRYLEQVNDGSIQPRGKYEVSRALPDARPAMPLLAA